MNMQREVYFQKSGQKTKVPGTLYLTKALPSLDANQSG